jgi:hypothetical protein
MHLQLHPSWYLFDADGPAPLRLLTDDGHADPSLSATPHGSLAALTDYRPCSTASRCCAFRSEKTSCGFLGAPLERAPRLGGLAASPGPGMMGWSIVMRAPGRALSARKASRTAILYWMEQQHWGLPARLKEPR